MNTIPDIVEVITNWAKSEPAVRALVLFGSRARLEGAPAGADRWSDVDLHLITDLPEKFESQSWTDELLGLDLCMYVVRAASGDVRKATLFFSSGEADIIVIPSHYSRRMRSVVMRGSSPLSQVSQNALNEMSTIMRGGYRFLKGERDWGDFYARVCADFPGQRLSDEAVVKMAEIFVCDLFGILQKIERGELVAAQRLLHRSLAETNFQLLHEARMRRKQPTFREARRVEILLSDRELAIVRVTARLNKKELRQAVRISFAGMRKLLGELVSNWHVPTSFERTLIPYLKTSR
jgi:hypothetical protein